jgi:hypothetical protein
MSHAFLAGFLFAVLGQVDATSAGSTVAEVIAEGTDERRPRGLAVNCPHCGRAVVAPSPTPRGEIPLAECDPCDLYFEVREVG